MLGVPHIYGAAAFSPERKFKTIEDARQVLITLEQAGLKHLNTAQLYGDSEKTLGQLRAGERFFIDTKAAGGAIPGALGRREVVRRAYLSLKNLGVEHINTFYIHMPDPTVPIEETLAGIQELYEAGVFRIFGISNYLAADVANIHAHCVENHYVLPTVYQGSYNPIARHAETELLPLLRRLKIAFYAYAPQAGGFLAKTKQEVLQGKGRLDPSTKGGQMLGRLYCKPTLLDCLAIWAEIAAQANCSPSELACRWVKYNSDLRAEFGDAVIFSSSSVSQTTETLKHLENGPLTAEITSKIDQVWDLVKHEAPVDNING